MAEPDIYGLLMGDDLSAEEQARLMASRMRGRQDLGELALLTGDPVLSRFGQALSQRGAGEQDVLTGALGNRVQRRFGAEQQGRQLGAAAREGALERANRLRLAQMGNDADMLRALLAQKGETQKRAAAAETELRKELMGNPVTKATQEVASAYGRVKAAAGAPSAAGDIALVYGFMKLMDPGSTVREGEFATAQNAGSVPQSVIAQYNKIISGERLAPGVRQDFLTHADRLYKAQADRYGALEGSYRQLAEGAGADPARVAIPIGLEVATPGSTTPTTSPGSPETMLGRDGKMYEKTPQGWRKVK